MSEHFQVIDLAYHQFRAEHYPMPIATEMEQLGEIIDLRVKRGLDALYADFATRPDVDYAGYLLTTYLHPQQRLDFQFPESAEALKLALVGAGAAVASGLRPDTQDFFLEFGDCFDIRALARQNPELWREGVYKQADFKENGYILGPVIRMQTNELTPADPYNQRADLVFSTRHAFFIPGTTLFEGLYKIDPRLREGFAIPRGLPHEYLAAAFDLLPKNTNFQDAWLAQSS